MSMLFRRPSQFTRRRPSSQAARPLSTSSPSVSSAQSPSLTMSTFCTPAAPHAPSVSCAASAPCSATAPCTSSASLVPSDLSSINPTILVDCNAVEPIHRVPGTASLYLPIEHLLTLPGHRAFTQHLCLPSEQQTRTSSTPAGNSSADAYPHSEGGPSPWSELHEGNLLTDGLQVSQDLFSSPSRNSRKKMRQWQWWSDEIIPSLVQPYLKYRQLSRNLCDHVTPELLMCKNHCVCHHLKILCINFDSKFPFLPWTLYLPSIRYTLH